MTTLGNERGGNATTQHVQYTKQFWDVVERGARSTARRPTRSCASSWRGPSPTARSCASDGLQILSEVVARKEPGPGGVDQQDVLVGVRPALRRDHHEHPRRRLDGDPSPEATAPTSYEPDKWQRTSSPPARAPSGAAPPRCSATSSASGCSACPRSPTPSAAKKAKAEQDGRRGDIGMTDDRDHDRRRTAEDARRSGHDPGLVGRAAARHAGDHRPDRRPHLRRAQRQRQPARPGAARAGASARRRRRAACAQPGRVRRDVRPRACGPASGSRRSTGTSPATRPATSSTTARPRRSSPTPRSADGAKGAAGRRRRTATVLLAVGGDIDGLRALRRGRRGRGRRRHRRPDAGPHDALHVGHDRAAQGRLPPAGAAAAAPAVDQHLRLPRGRAATSTSAPGRCTTPPRWPSRWPRRSPSASASCSWSSGTPRRRCG